MFEPYYPLGGYRSMTLAELSQDIAQSKKDVLAYPKERFTKFFYKNLLYRLHSEVRESEGGKEIKLTLKPNNKKLAQRIGAACT